MLRSDGVLVLTITNGEGNQAIYGNMFLATDEINSEKIIIYQNPTEGLLFIDSATEPIDGLDLFTIFGEKIRSLEGNIQSLDISNLASDMYLLKLASETGVTISRIIKK